MEVSVYNIKGQDTGKKVELNDAIFGIEPNDHVIYLAVKQYLANQRQGQVWIRIFPDKPITKKPADVRMGKGKGDPYKYVFPAKPGRILFEVEGVPYEVAKEALRLGAQKLPTTTKFIVRRDYDKNAD